MNSSREPVRLLRQATVERVPSGERMELAAGTLAHITQALGTTFTLYVEGQLVRLQGTDADAIGKPVPVSPVLASATTNLHEARDLVWQTLKTCYDPEIPIDIVELGLVYRCDIQPTASGLFNVTIEMTLTAPGCGMGESLINEVADKVLALGCIEEIKVVMVFDPPWNRAMMSEAAQLTLGL
ncbi:MAG TPA: putative Fe-S cluster assembly protein SufT [Aquabacterium sp.]|nr:putative Fe-S cluster assembly protein SufT [Aquabacterium sp.]